MLREAVVSGCPGSVGCGMWKVWALFQVLQKSSVCCALHTQGRPTSLSGTVWRLGVAVSEHPICPAETCNISFLISLLRAPGEFLQVSQSCSSLAVLCVLWHIHPLPCPTSTLPPTPMFRGSCLALHGCGLQCLLNGTEDDAIA